MSTTDHKQLIRQSVSGFYNRGDVSVLGRIYADDYVGHDPHGIKAGDTLHADTKGDADGVNAAVSRSAGARTRPSPSLSRCPKRALSHTPA